MRKKSTILTSLGVIVIGTLLLACATAPTPTEVPTPTEKNFRTPVVTFNYVEAPYYTGWWYFSNKVQPTKGTAGNYGAPLNLAFIFDIENPNPYPVLMEGFAFTVAFEEFDLNTISVPETQWIPAGKSNQIRANGMFDARAALLSLLVTGGFKLKEKGMSPWDALEKWWTEASQFALPIHVKEGAAVFKADGVTTVATFSGTFP